MLRGLGSAHHERSKIAGLFALALCGVLLGVLRHDAQIVVMGVAAAVAVSAAVLMRPLFVSLILKQQPLLGGDCYATVDASNGVEIGNATWMRRFAWSDIGDVVESDRLFTLVLPAERRTFAGLPKRGVLAPATEDALRAILVAQARVR